MNKTPPNNRLWRMNKQTPKITSFIHWGKNFTNERRQTWTYLKAPRTVRRRIMELGGGGEGRGRGRMTLLRSSVSLAIYILLLFVFVSALQTSDPDWYSALTSVLTSEQAKSLQEVFHQAEQRKASLGKNTEEYLLVTKFLIKLPKAFPCD